MVKCDNCHKGNKGHYRSIYLEKEDKRFKPPRIVKKLQLWCYDCLNYGSGSRKTDQQMFEHISTPWWVHAGVKPNAQQKRQLEYIKQHNMSWGDLRKERYANMPKSGVDGSKAFTEHLNKYGTRNAPEVRYKKES